jgi:TRAP-type C4-dicarboxylate transport system permease small subunit
VKKISDLLGKGITGCLFITLIILIAITLWQVTCRFILFIPVHWSEEVVRMSFVWLIFLGSAAACKDGTHLVLDMLTGKISRKKKFMLHILVLLFMLIVEALILYAGIEYVGRSFGKTTVTLPVPANAVYISVPVSAALMIFFTVETLYREITGKEEAR